MSTQKEVSEAVKVLTKALKEDPEYRRAWVANIAMAFYDEYNSTRPTNKVGVQQVSNKAAEVFLQNLCYVIDLKEKLGLIK